jgi:hypothetical protein
MNKFQKGQLIRAVEDAGSLLTKGNIYEVLDIMDSHSNIPLVKVRSNHGELKDFYEFRFEVVKPTKKLGEFM